MLAKSDTEYQVLKFLKKELAIVGNSNRVMTFYGVGAKDLVKYFN